MQKLLTPHLSILRYRNFNKQNKVLTKSGSYCGEVLCDKKVRDKPFEVDPPALCELLRAGEVIDPIGKSDR